MASSKTHTQAMHSGISLRSRYKKAASDADRRRLKIGSGMARSRYSAYRVLESYSRVRRFPSGVKPRSEGMSGRISEGAGEDSTRRRGDAEEERGGTRGRG